jgi:NAD+ kinase
MSPIPMTDRSISRIGVVVHPTRELDTALDAVREFASERGVDVVQLEVEGNDRRVAEAGRAEDSDLVVAIGGDGTMLAAARAAALADRPVLGVACGSLGVLTTVGAYDARTALDRFAAGDWIARDMPALKVDRDGGETLTGLNDLAVLRRGQGQVTTAAEVDGVLYARFVGDGFVVSTPIGSSGYTLAAQGPLLATGTTASVLTPLAAHGGCVPPLVFGEDSKLRLDVVPGYGGIRVELDGRPVDPEPERGSMTIELVCDAVTVVGLDDEEPVLSGLRRRKIIIDSPRVMARDLRDED